MGMVMGKIKALYKQSYILNIKMGNENMQLIFFFETLLQNELKRMLRVLPPTNHTLLATNQVVTSCVNTDF